MNRETHGGRVEGNPLLDPSPEAWYSLICAVGPPSLLVVIGSWLTGKVRASVTAEDVWQDALLEAWRNREHFEWRGVRAFRRWLLTLARNRITRIAEEQLTQKRGGGTIVTPLSVLDPEDGSPMYAGPVRTTTPSQAMRDREIADAMEAVLVSLPDEIQSVLRLYLFEDRRITDIAEALGLSESGVRHRIRRGVSAFRTKLSSALGEGMWVEEPDRRKP